MMTLRIHILLVMICALATSALAAPATMPAIIPQPAAYTAGEGEFVLSEKTVLIAGDDLRPAAEYFAEFVAPAIGAKLRIADANDAANAESTIAFTSLKAPSES